MSSRVTAFWALTLATFATLLVQSLCYGLVYPAGARLAKWPVALGLASGVLSVGFACWLSLRAYRGASVRSERFFALLTLFLSGFLLFVVVVGFGVPQLFLGVRD